MTNEELATLVAQGRDDLQLQLWEGVERFVHQQAYRAFMFSGGQGGTTVDDLEQQGFFAMLKAAEAFDPERGSFLSCLSFYLRRAFAEIGGYATSKRDPLDQCLSLDTPVAGGEDGDGLETYADGLADPDDVYELAEESIYNDQLRGALDRAIDRLPPTRAEIMRAVYWDGKSQTEIAEEQGVTFQNVSNHLKRGLADLRTGSAARELRQFLDEQTDFYGGTGTQAFKTSGSAVERLVIRREALAEHWLEEHGETG